MQNLEQGLGFSKELLYAAAILHDITKWKQYRDGVPHNESAILPARNILHDCEFTDEEVTVICHAILHHRDGAPDDPFSDLLFRADKLSRACYVCTAAEDCHWDANRKNKVLHY